MAPPLETRKQIHQQHAVKFNKWKRKLAEAQASHANKVTLLNLQHAYKSFHEADFYDANEESSRAEEESVARFQEAMEKCNQNMATKGHSRELAIAMLEEQN